MSEYDPHLNVEVLTRTKDTNYAIRKIELEKANIKLETPFKITEGKNITQEMSTLLKHNISEPLLESGVYVLQYNTWSRLKYLIEEADEEKIPGLDKIFGLRKTIWDYSKTVSSLVFSKNPFVQNVFGSDQGKKTIAPFDKESYYGLLDYIHTASSAMVLSPDIRIYQKNIDLDDYLHFVDDNVKVLSTFNNKPLFVPIQTHLAQKSLRKILEHYKKQKYTNIWINFNAGHIGGTYFTRVRTLLRILDEIIGLNNVVLYYSHLKKEINPHMKDERVAASDILTQFFAADFIGINREPSRRIVETPQEKEERIKELIMKGEYKSMQEYESMLNYHKARIFDPNTYYYYRLDKYPYKLPLTKKILLKKDVNKMLNSIVLFKEVENTKHFIEQQEEKLLIPYIKKKKAIEENEEILQGITTEKEKGKQKDIFEFLGGL